MNRVDDCHVRAVDHFRILDVELTGPVASFATDCMPLEDGSPITVNRARQRFEPVRMAEQAGWHNRPIEVGVLFFRTRGTAPSALGGHTSLSATERGTHHVRSGSWLPGYRSRARTGPRAASLRAITQPRRIQRPVSLVEERGYPAVSIHVLEPIGFEQDFSAHGSVADGRGRRRIE